MSEVKHTALPWSFRRIEARDYGECQYSLTHNGDQFVCVGTCITREEDARHIVKSANYHHRLVEALRDLTEACDNLEFEAGRVDAQKLAAEDLLAELDHD